MRARPLVVLLAVALTAGACQEALPVGPQPVVGEASDQVFAFTVRSPASRYAPGQPIEVFAEIVYQGNRNQETLFHAASPVGWQIVQQDGPAVMGGGMDLPCLQTQVQPGRPVRVPFQKSGAIEPGSPFDRAWYEQPALTLPAGRWRIRGQLMVALGDCGGERHELEATIDLLVAS